MGNCQQEMKISSYFVNIAIVMQKLAKQFIKNTNKQKEEIVKDNNNGKEKDKDKIK